MLLKISIHCFKLEAFFFWDILFSKSLLHLETCFQVIVFFIMYPYKYENVVSRYGMLSRFYLQVK